MPLSTILIVVLVLLLIGIAPAWPHSRQWGNGPAGIVLILVVVLLILMLVGRL